MGSLISKSCFPSTKRIDLIKEEIIKFLTILYDECYKTTKEDAQCFDGSNFREYFTRGDLMEYYSPSKCLTLNEIEEVIYYLRNYGEYTTQSGVKTNHYNGCLRDWNAFEIVKMNNNFEPSGLYKPNKSKGISRLKRGDEYFGFVVGVVISLSIPTEEIKSDFYYRCSRLAKAFIIKYDTTLFENYGSDFEKAINLFCKKVKDAKFQINSKGVTEIKELIFYY